MRGKKLFPNATPVVRSLIFINIAVFFVTVTINNAINEIVHNVFTNQLIDIYALSSEQVIHEKWIWQLVTYMFLHTDLLHLFVNMLALYMFGPALEKEWDSREFLKFYLVCGIGAGLFIVLLPLLLKQPTVTTLGASGAIFGLLLAYAVYWPERQLLFMFFIPIKAKYFVLLVGALSLFFTLYKSDAGEISHVAHLGGLVIGYFYLLLRIQHPKVSPSWLKGYLSWQKWLRRIKQMYQQDQKKVTGIRDLEKQIDFLLDKISKYGVKSLSSTEKKFLEKASKELEKRKKNKKNNSHDPTQFS